MLIKHTESVSFDIKNEWQYALNFQKDHPDWVVSEGTETITYTKENHFIYNLEENK